MLDVKQLFLGGHWSLLTVAPCICVVWLVGSDFPAVVVYNTRHILGAAVIYLPLQCFNFLECAAI